MVPALNNIELLSEYLEKNPNTKLYGNYKFRMGMFYGFLLGSGLTFIFMLILNT